LQFCQRSQGDTEIVENCQNFGEEGGGAIIDVTHKYCRVSPA
jgi:hypothetical protein